MNDLSFLDRFGPEPATPTDDTLARARQRLAAEMMDAAPSSVRRPVLRRTAILAAAAAVAACAALVSPFGSDEAIALVSVDPVAFPVTATYLPNGLPLERFTFSAQGMDAMYGEDPSCESQEQACGADRLTLSVRDSFAYWDVDHDAAQVDVAGHPGRGFYAPWNDHHPEYSIVWELTDGEIVGVTGEGRYSDPATVERIADSVTETSQPVDLFLTIAPKGWPLYGYLSDHYVMYGDHGELAVTLLDRPEIDLSAAGASDVRPVTVNGRPAELGRITDDQGQAWVLQTTAPDGQGFNLNAPGALTEDQVIEIAAGVQHR
jgi:hypothetical protein